MDSRCADPELQLDVDIMILEYTLFHAIEAQFQLLANGPEGDADQVKRHEAVRRMAIFDSFIHIFNERHSKYEHTPGLNFRFDILEFLVLFTGLSSASLHRFPLDMLQGLDTHVQEDLKARRRWQTSRARHFRRLEKLPASSSQAAVDREVEMQTYAAWSNFQDASRPAPTAKPIRVLVLQSLLSRFMAISAKFLTLMGELEPGLNRSWIGVACELIFLTSLESVRLQTEYLSNGDLPKLEDCFAWGYNNSDTSLDGRSTTNDEIDDLVNHMFRLGEREDPDWTRFRLETLHEFSITPDASHSSRSCRLERLADKYPLEDFSQKLVHLLQNVWQLSCRDDLLGKPVLVEIEEGHLESLDLVGREFEDFARRVGLTRSFDSLEYININAGHRWTTGLLVETNLSERYEQELERRKRLSSLANGTSPVIKLED